MSDRDAKRYEKLYPGTGCSEPQKEERMQRMDFYDESTQLRRTSRNRGIIVPYLEWLHGPKDNT